MPTKIMCRPQRAGTSILLEVSAQESESNLNQRKTWAACCIRIFRWSHVAPPLLAIHFHSTQFVDLKQKKIDEFPSHQRPSLLLTFSLLCLNDFFMFKFHFLTIARVGVGMRAESLGHAPHQNKREKKKKMRNKFGLISFEIKLFIPPCCCLFHVIATSYFSSILLSHGLLSSHCHHPHIYFFFPPLNCI